MKLRLQLGFAAASIAGLLIVASPAGAAADSCSNAAIRAAQNSAFLPECRAYELVSPVDKVGGQVASALGFAPSAGGDKIAYQAYQAFADSVSAGVYNDYLATRTSSGWVTAATSPRVPSEFQATSVHQLYSPDLGRGLLNAWPVRPPVPPLTPDTPETPRKTLYMTDFGTGAHTLITKATPQFGFPSADWFSIGATDRELERVLFTASEVELTPEASPGVPNAYEWHNGELSLAGILPDSACGTPPCVAPASETAGGAFSDRAMSEDGSRVFFQIPTGAGTEGLFVRENGSSTRQIGDLSAYFLAATRSDGSKVLYKDFACGLCILDLETDETTPVDVDSEPADGVASFRGVVAVSDDLSRVYFGVDGRLTPGEGEAGPLASSVNMYAWHDGELRFVGYFDTGEGPDTVFNGANGAIAGGTIARADDSSLTPDGTRLVFSSISQPTGYDNLSPNCVTTASVSERCSEVYAYDALANEGDGELICLSCNPAGATGPSSLTTIASEVFQGNAKRRNISDDGRVAFFETAEPLVAGDANAAIDVYSYDFASGELRLISTGTDTADAHFAGTDEAATNAFFTTLRPLVRRDVDAANDLYAARIGGGFAEPGPAPPCRGEDCQGGSTPTPPGLAPASQSVVGPGNARQRPKRKKAKCRKRGTAKQQQGKAGKRSLARTKNGRCAKAKGGK